MDKVINKIKEISLKYKNINKIVLFGSRARGDNTNSSDYDIAVFTYNMIDAEKTAFVNDIETIDTLNKIDIIWIKERHKNTELYNNILLEGVEIMNKFQNKLTNYKNAVSRLHEALEEAKNNESLTIRDGVIQRFEFTTELAWKTLREYLILQEISELNSPKAVMTEAFNNNLITDEDGWLKILHDRNATSHIYDEEDASDIYERIVTKHTNLFDKLLNKLTETE